MAINLNTEPYNDDFDESKNFYQILFKPSLAVQARELTQLQTILRDQIKKFGNHIFQHGSVVIPGNSLSDLAVPYVKLQKQYNGLDVNINNFADKVVVGVTSGLKAIVKKVVQDNQSDPITFYLSYVSGNSSGIVTFIDGEEIYVEDATSSRALLQSTNATGVGSLAYINKGVYYIHGSFVYVAAQNTIISKYDSSPSCHVLLKIVEEIIDYSEDETLLDNAQSSYNYAAPGADRLQISLELTTLPLSSQLTDDYVEIMRFNQGVLEEHSRNPKYSELEKSLARRTYDESGDYVVRGITPTVRQHLKTSTNNGVYTSQEGGDNNKLVVEVSPGKAYINGFEIEKLANTKLTVDKARTEDHVKNTDVILRPEFGQYIVVSNISKWLSVYSHETISIYNDNDASNASATLIGTAKVVGIDYLNGSGAGAIYKLWINDLNLVSNHTISEAGGIRYNSGGYAYVLTQYNAPINAGAFTVGEVVTYTSGSTTRTATVKYWDSSSATLYAYKHDHTKETPKLGDSIVGASSATSSIIAEKRLITAFGMTSNLFPLPKSIPFSLVDPDTNAYNFSYTVQKEFTISTDSSGDGSTGVISGGVIQAIEVGTFLAVGSSGIIDNAKFSLNVPGTEITIDAGPANDTVKIFANVLKRGDEGASPKTKTITNNSETFKVWVASTSFSLNDYVFYSNSLYKVTTAGTTSSTAPSHTSGSASNGTATLLYVSKLSTITLAKTDVIGLTSVIDNTGDITNRYTYWNGQTDYFYNRGELRLKPNKANPTSNFTVTYTYYQHSVTGDFFCINSYASVPNFLEEINIYKSETNGYAYDLCSYLDFRPSVGADGTWTGSGSRRNDLLVSGTAFSSTLQYYVPRIDSIVIDAAGIVAAIRGIPSESPVSPQIAAGQLELNRIYFKEYTRSLADISGKRLDVERFTMQDIKKITNRVKTLENYALLTNSEINALNYDVIDATTGLNRYKTGYIVESFKDPFSIARSTNVDYKASFVNDTLRAPIQPQICNLQFIEADSSNYENVNNFIMLPFTEEVFAKQSLSSRTNNINPFVVIRWDGYLDVSPKNDIWVEVIDNPTVFENTTEEVIVNNYIPCPVYSSPSYDYSPPAVTAVLNYFIAPDGTPKYQIVENTAGASSYAASLNSDLGRTMVSSVTVTGSSYSAIQNQISAKISSGELAYGAKVNLFTGIDQPGSTVTIARTDISNSTSEKVYRTYSATDPVGSEVRIY